jgi:hypothetical protein
LKKLVYPLLLILVLTGCSLIPKEPEVIKETVIVVVTATPITPSPTRKPTSTPKPTSTSNLPTATPGPTSTPEYVVGNTSSGNWQVDDVWLPAEYSEGAILRITHSGNSVFNIKQYAEGDDDWFDLLLNNKGTYHGLRPINWIETSGRKAVMLRITYSGPWSIESWKLNMDNINILNAPAKYKGTMHDILGVSVSTDAVISFKCEEGKEGTNYFRVWAYGDDRKQSLGGSLCPYEFSKDLPPGLYLLEVDTYNSLWEMSVR